MANTILIGTGGVGSIAALNLERGGRAAVTVVLRSSYEIVKARGFNIESIDHGTIKGFRPSQGT
jgi:ketopantoate reductase